MTRIAVRSLRKSFGSTDVLRNIDLDVDSGQFVVFVGPSGCGKSTLLRLICGIEEVTAGTIAIDGEIVNDVPPARRGIAMVFQSYALYPHMTVAQNMGYALRLAGVERSEIDARVAKALRTLLYLVEQDEAVRLFRAGVRRCFTDPGRRACAFPPRP
ncbi:MAG: ABC transporter ATP-binding protein [Nitrospiraceae bacterium]|nr:ABC transporter ATP-binding protein [Nitrospiraceae bacterium]